MNSRRLRFRVLLAVALTGPAVAALAGPPASSSSASPGSLQERFDAATAAWDRGDCATAVPLFDALAGDPRVRPGSLPAAAIAVRRGDCLLQTGVFERGEALIAQGLPMLRGAGHDFDEEVARAESELGALAMRRWDHDSALSHLQAALVLQRDAARLPTLMRVALLTAFDGDQAGLKAAEEGIAIVSASPKPDKQALSQFHAAHGRILLNQGRIKEARDELYRAFELVGGMTDTVSIANAATRADLAEASMLAGRKDDAYLYMAGSGAGRVGNSPFATPLRLEPPACGPDTGLEPSDSAVIEFAIADDGQVAGAEPVYSTAGYAKASTFARAVMKWLWKPEDAAKMPKFFRLATRVELHCTNATSGIESDSPLTPLKERFRAWASQVLTPYFASEHTAARPGWIEILGAAEAANRAGDAKAELAARVVLIEVDLRGDKLAGESFDRALLLANQPDIPQQEANAARVLLAVSRWRVGRLKYPRDLLAKGDPVLLELARQPAIAADPLAQDGAILRGVALRPDAAGVAETTAAIAQVAADSRLSEHHPLRQYAALRLANDAARAGNLAAAQKWFQTTGLSEQQCALIGPKPDRTSSITSDAFPLDALRYGFEGWVSTEFDIQADGHTAGVRPLIAYPPFIFVPATSAVFDHARYQASYRPSGGTACSANTETVRYLIPGNNNVSHEVPAKTKSHSHGG